MAKKEEDILQDKGTLWNIDDAESRLIFNLKLKFLEAISSWDLETAFWRLCDLDMESDALLDEDTEASEIDTLIEALSNTRNEYIKYVEPSEELKQKHHSELSKIYKKICRHLKAHGLYFREGEAEEDGL